MPYWARIIVLMWEVLVSTECVWRGPRTMPLMMQRPADGFVQGRLEANGAEAAAGLE